MSDSFLTTTLQKFATETRFEKEFFRRFKEVGVLMNEGRSFLDAVREIIPKTKDGLAKSVLETLKWELTSDPSLPLYVFMMEQNIISSAYYVFLDACDLRTESRASIFQILPSIRIVSRYFDDFELRLMFTLGHLMRCGISERSVILMMLPREENEYLIEVHRRLKEGKTLRQCLSILLGKNQIRVELINFIKERMELGKTIEEAMVEASTAIFQHYKSL